VYHLEETRERSYIVQLAEYHSTEIMSELRTGKIPMLNGGVSINVPSVPFLKQEHDEISLMRRLAHDMSHLFYLPVGTILS
jgi:hypothetical protein